MYCKHIRKNWIKDCIFYLTRKSYNYILKHVHIMEFSPFHEVHSNFILPLMFNVTNGRGMVNYHHLWKLYRLQNYHHKIWLVTNTLWRNETYFATRMHSQFKNKANPGRGPFLLQTVSLQKLLIVENIENFLYQMWISELQIFNLTN